MKNLLIMLLFGIVCSTTATAQKTLYINSESPINGRILVIEEDQNSVYAYIMQKNNKGIEFDGFLCSVTNPFNNNLDLNKLKAAGGPPPLIEKYANRFSYIKNLKEKDIQIEWSKKTVVVSIRGEKYLIMDLANKVSYSKALKLDGPYGRAMAK